jgi:hypothetical protein
MSSSGMVPSLRDKTTQRERIDNMTWTLVVRAAFKNDLHSTEGNRLKVLLKKQGFVQSDIAGHRCWKKTDVSVGESVKLIEELLRSPIRSTRPVRRIQRLSIEAKPAYDTRRAV